MKFNKVQYFFHRLHLFCWSFTSHFKICHQNSTPTRNNIFLKYVSVCKMEDGQMSERFFRSKRPGYPHPVSSELEYSGIRVAVSDCSVTGHRRWRKITIQQPTYIPTYPTNLPYPPTYTPNHLPYCSYISYNAI